jgi:hypothetical protein
MYRRNIFIAAMAIAVGVSGGSIFYACKKDPVNSSMLNGKSKQDVGVREYAQYEGYTPDKCAMKEKLLLLNDYVKKPTEYSMPGMELKEAIWFLEAYFNIAVCSKQEYFSDQLDKEKKYLIKIPFEEEDGNIILKGNVLQEQYGNLLSKIKTDICPEFVINFGDVYVHALDWNAKNLTLGMEIVYGIKQEKSGTYPYSPDPDDPSYHEGGWDDNGGAWMSLYRFRKILYPESTVVYPYYATQQIDDIIHPGPPMGGVRDDYMTYVLNQALIMSIPTSIVEKKVYANVVYHYPSHYGNYPFSYDQVKGFPYTIPISQLPNYKNECVHWGSLYRDNIHALYPIYPYYDYEIFWGFCEYYCSPINNQWYIEHAFGISKLCKFLWPDDYMNNLHF